MATLAEIRARIAEQDNKTQRGSVNGDGSTYPHWNIADNASVTARFLPDGNDSNPFFWVERQLIKLPFNGIKNDPNSRRITVQVPCVEMYGDNCPILAEVRPWYKDESLKEKANLYWKKRSYIYHGFVRINPLVDDVTPPNPIRKFIISSQIQTIIRASLMDPELEESPVDFERGLDFNIRKTPGKGGYSEYTTSSWARRESPLTDAERQAIAAFSIPDLTEYLPKKPSESEMRVIREMFEASVDDQPYDLEKWGAYYKPYGLGDAPTSASSDTTSSHPTSANITPNTSVDAADDEAPWEVSEPVEVPTSTNKTEAVLELIRKRQAQAKQS